MANYHKLSDFVTLRKGRSFRATAKCSPSQEAHIYQWLKQEGFGISTIGSRTVMFQRNNDNIEPTSVIVMKHHFQDFLETAQFTDWR
jgi:lipid-binding SYLF domain-containing protein